MLINAIGQLAAAFLATIPCAEETVDHLWTDRNLGMAGVSAGEALLFQYTGMFCGNCGNRILCTVVCCLAESAVERIYDIRDLSYRPRYRYL